MMPTIAPIKSLACFVLYFHGDLGLTALSGVGEYRAYGYSNELFSSPGLLCETGSYGPNGGPEWSSFFMRLRGAGVARLGYRVSTVCGVDGGRLLGSKQAATLFKKSFPGQSVGRDLRVLANSGVVIAWGDGKGDGSELFVKSLGLKDLHLNLPGKIRNVAVTGKFAALIDGYEALEIGLRDGKISRVEAVDSIAFYKEEAPLFGRIKFHVFPPEQDETDLVFGSGKLYTKIPARVDVAAVSGVSDLVGIWEVRRHQGWPVYSLHHGIRRKLIGLDNPVMDLVSKRWTLFWLSV